MRRFSIGYHGKMLFIALGFAIGVASLVYSNYLVSRLREKERHDIHLWAQAFGLTIRGTEQEDVRQQTQFIAQFINSADDIPVILCDDNLRVRYSRKIDASVLADPVRLKNKLESMRSGGRNPIELPTPEGATLRVYYDESGLLRSLQYFPLIQLGIFAVFIGIAFIAFRSSKHSEQNRVWIGMAKETAHQLGTPTSSLLGWIEYLRGQPVESFVVEEMNKDLTRLLKVVDRFSKIGAATNLEPRNIHELVAGAVNYFQARIPKNVTLNFEQRTAEPMQGLVNDALFEWVVENLLKNALDALQGKGELNVRLSVRDRKWICIDVQDSGRGIQKANFKRIFQPGFTTKTRGWGLGLSLSKRIVEEYHHGRIFVLDSEINKGTTMRIMIRKV